MCNYLLKFNKNISSYDLNSSLDNELIELRCDLWRNENLWNLNIDKFPSEYSKRSSKQWRLPEKECASTLHGYFFDECGLISRLEKCEEKPVNITWKDPYESDVPIMRDIWCARKWRVLLKITRAADELDESKQREKSAPINR